MANPEMTIRAHLPYLTVMMSDDFSVERGLILTEEADSFANLTRDK